MSTPATIPMIAPDGSVADVPLVKMMDGLRMGAKIGVDMVHAGSGERGVIPQDRYKDALAQGLVPYSKPATPVPAALQGSPEVPQKSFMDRASEVLNYPLMPKLSPTYAADRQTDETLAHGPTSQYENEHPVLGYLRRKMAQGALMAEDAITPGTVATSALTGGARMLGSLPGVAGKVATGATLANKALSGVYGASSLKSGYDAATNDQLSTRQRLAGLGMGLAGGALGAADIGAGKPLAAPLQASAEKTYSKFLNPTRIDTKAMTQDIVPELLEQGQRASSLGSLSDVAAGKLRDLGQQIDAHAAAIPSNVRPDMSNVLGDMQNFQNGFSAGGNIVNKAGHDHAQQVIDTLKQFGDGSQPISGLNTNPSFQDMRTVRQILDKPVAEAGGYAGRTVADQSLLNAQKAGADAVRAELARQSPELDSLNKQYNFWAKVKDVSDASADRKVGQKGYLKAVIPAVLGSAGIAHGGVTGGLESLPLLVGVGAYTTPIGQTVRATGKASLARALSGADIGANGKLLQRSLAGDVSRYGSGQN